LTVSQSLPTRIRSGQRLDPIESSAAVGTAWPGYTSNVLVLILSNQKVKENTINEPGEVPPGR